jgi:hypothetical protein
MKIIPLSDGNFRLNEVDTTPIRNVSLSTWQKLWFVGGVLRTEVSLQQQLAVN